MSDEPDLAAESQRAHRRLLAMAQDDPQVRAAMPLAAVIDAMPDMFTRLLFSFVAAGVAPESFNERKPDGGRARAHYDGLPVDFLAAAMSRIGAEPHAGFTTYNMINLHHDDGISLDSIADWVISAGYPIRRVADHGDWWHRFGDRLRQLPDDQRQRCSIAILGHFEHPHPARPDPVRSDRFAAVAGVVPHLSKAFVHKYLADMRAQGLIPEPQPAAEPVLLETAS